MKKAHKEVPVKVIAWIDAGIVPLVHALNSIPGFKTNSSCQGYTKDCPAFVEFQCEDYSNWKGIGTFLFDRFYKTLPLSLRTRVSINLTAHNHFSPEWVIGKIMVDPDPKTILAVSRYIQQLMKRRPISS